MTSVLFARRITAPQLCEYANSFDMKLHWVQIYSTHYCAEYISDSIRDVYFMQLGPFADFVDFLRKRNITMHLINTEQLTRVVIPDEIVSDEEEKEYLQNQVPFPFQDYIFHYLQGPNPICVSVTDYSFANLEILKQKISVCVTRKLHCFMPLVAQQRTTTGDKGIVFVGDAGSSYRKDILKQIPNVRILTHQFGPRRDGILQTYRILINIHYAASYLVFEELRCLPCILSKIIVVSETSKLDQRHPICKFIVFAPRDALAKTARDINDNYQTWFHKLFVEQKDLFDTLKTDIVAYQNNVTKLL